MATSSVGFPWLVRTNYWMRMAAFASLFLAGSLHMAPSGSALIAWAVLGAMLLAYPQVQYVRARHAADPRKAEFLSLLMDPVVVGVFVVAVHFSLWLTFFAVLGTLINNVTYRGWRYLPLTLLGFVAGGVAMVSVSGFHVSWPTSAAATAVSMVGIGGYLLSLGHFGFRRNLDLRRAREQLQMRDIEILAAHAKLQSSREEISALQLELEEHVHRDGLTGLHNRRFLDQTLKREVSRSTRDGQPLAFIMIDVDEFKKYNDSFGHPAGDACLKQIASCIQSFSKRATDTAARFGGAEFSLVLANTDATCALRMAQQLRQKVEAMNLPHPLAGPGRVTLSLGVAVMTVGLYDGVDALIDAADAAVYVAKRAGRNQVQLADIAAVTHSAKNRIGPP